MPGAGPNCNGDKRICGNERFISAHQLSCAGSTAGAKIYFQPGHSRGHTVLVYDGMVAFTGDHLARLESTGELGVFADYCWYR
eukprot:575917-Pyramimonas_sp.AAC.1